MWFESGAPWHEPMPVNGFSCNACWQQDDPEHFRDCGSAHVAHVAHELQRREAGKAVDEAAEQGPDQRLDQILKMRDTSPIGSGTWLTAMGIGKDMEGSVERVLLNCKKWEGFILDWELGLRWIGKKVGGHIDYWIGLYIGLQWSIIVEFNGIHLNCWNWEGLIFH